MKKFTVILLIMSKLQANGLRQLLCDTRGDDCGDIDHDANQSNILEDSDGGTYDGCVWNGMSNDNDSNDNGIAKYTGLP